MEIINIKNPDGTETQFVSISISENETYTIEKTLWDLANSDNQAQLAAQETINAN